MKKSFYTNKDSAITDALWSEALENLKKDAVETSNVHDRINNIVGNNQKKFKSVAEKVNDMIERSGFDKFKKSQVKTSNASAPEEKKPTNEIKMFVVCPSCKNTVDNICASSKGLLPIPSILGRAKDIHNQDVIDASLWTDPKFLSYVANRNLSCKVESGTQHQNLGKIEYNDDRDPSSDDVFGGLESNIK